MMRVRLIGVRQGRRKCAFAIRVVALNAGPFLTGFSDATGKVMSEFNIFTQQVSDAITSLGIGLG